MSAPPPPQDAATLTSAEVLRVRGLLRAARYREEVAAKPDQDPCRGARGGIWFKQLTLGDGRGVARKQDVRDAAEEKVFGAAAQMKNLIYLVGDIVSRQCVCIDAAWDVRGIARVAAEHKMALVGAIATHHHWDHTGGFLENTPFQAMVHGPFAGKLANGARPRLCGMYEMRAEHSCTLYAHKKDIAPIARNIGVATGEVEELGHKSRVPLGRAGHLEMLHTPGHSRGSICLCVVEAGAGARAVVTRHLFPRSTGRLDCG